MSTTQISIKDIVDPAIEFNRTTRPIAADYSQGSFAEQFCTVQINLGRKKGMTDYIAEAAKSGDLVVVSFPNLISYLRNLGCIADRIISIRDLLSFCSPVPIDRHDTIWVDNPNDCFYRLGDKTNFYQKTAFDKNQTFILLG